jgi:hypothetical protein
LGGGRYHCEVRMAEFHTTLRALTIYTLYFTIEC